MTDQNKIPKFWEDRTTKFSMLVATDNFRLLKYDNPIYPTTYPYSLEHFNPIFGWEPIIDLGYSDLAELLKLFNDYQEEK